MRCLTWSVLAVTAAVAGCAAWDSGQSTLNPNAGSSSSKSASSPADSALAGTTLIFSGWHITQFQVEADRYLIAMRKNLLTLGGDGEAAQIFFRRAAQLTRESGAVHFRVIEFSEGVDSSLLISQRVANGVVEVIR